MQQFVPTCGQSSVYIPTLDNIHTYTSHRLSLVYCYTKQIFAERADTHVADKLYEHVLIVEVLVNSH